MQDLDSRIHFLRDLEVWRYLWGVWRNERLKKRGLAFRLWTVRWACHKYTDTKGWDLILLESQWRKIHQGEKDSRWGWLIKLDQLVEILLRRRKTSQHPWSLCQVRCLWQSLEIKLRWDEQVLRTGTAIMRLIWSMDRLVGAKTELWAILTMDIMIIWYDSLY